MGSGDIQTEMKPWVMIMRVLNTWIVAEERGEDRTSLRKGQSEEGKRPLIEP